MSYPRSQHLALIPDETPSVDCHGMVSIKAVDLNERTNTIESVSLMLFTDQARELRDQLNALDLGPVGS